MIHALYFYEFFFNSDALDSSSIKLNNKTKKSAKEWILQHLVFNEGHARLSEEMSRNTVRIKVTASYLDLITHSSFECQARVKLFFARRKLCVIDRFTIISNMRMSCVSGE